MLEAGAVICKLPSMAMTGVYAVLYWLPPRLVVSCRVSFTSPEAAELVWKVIVNSVNPSGVRAEFSRGCCDGLRLGLLP